jgi:hypothetical protein
MYSPRSFDQFAAPQHIPGCAGHEQIQRHDVRDFNMALPISNPPMQDATIEPVRSFQAKQAGAEDMGVLSKTFDVIHK